MLALNRISRTRGAIAQVASSFHTTAPVKSEEKAPEGGGFLGTSLSPLYAIPAGIFAGIPIIQNQWLILDAETQLVGCFAAFTITAYTQGGDAIAKMMDDKAQVVIDEHNAAEDLSIAAVESVIEGHKKRLAVLKDIEIMETVSDEYIKKAEAVAPNVQVHAVNAAIEKALQDILNKEIIAREKVSQSLAKDTVVAVRDAFNGDAKAVANSEAYAIKALMGGDAGAHPIDQSFLSVLKSTADAAAKEEKANKGKIIEDAEANEILSKTIGGVAAKMTGTA
ncbi:hypothetical protein TrVE_jg10518 [Triparma verrucosa]|uniref:ATP synthase subunit b n=1 Tax=Triparma verrucosa TaxID=1606542 RepID=A0A9W7KX78_9STRA|nr:hypothetical protein TrVE_jg10518 [Triparma verrucosa]